MSGPERPSTVRSEPGTRSGRIGRRSADGRLDGKVRPAGGDQAVPERRGAHRPGPRRRGGDGDVPARLAVVERRAPDHGHGALPLLHVGYNLSGRLHVELADGSTLDIGPGEVFEIT